MIVVDDVRRRHDVDDEDNNCGFVDVVAVDRLIRWWFVDDDDDDGEDRGSILVLCS